jgi:hypothetical protein
MRIRLIVAVSFLLINFAAVSFVDNRQDFFLSTMMRTSRKGS